MSGGPGMGQVVKLCNNMIYAAQMTATAEATALAMKSGVGHGQALGGSLCIQRVTGVAVRTRLPVPGVVPDSPASNGWKPGFMTDLMVKDLDLAPQLRRQGGGAIGHDDHRPRSARSGVRRRLRAPRLLGRGQGGPRAGWRRVNVPSLILAADHRAPRGQNHRALRRLCRGASRRPAVLRRDAGVGPAAR